MAGRNPTDRNELAGMVNLMAHPMAGMAAASALGVGMAAQMVGAWIGAVEGSLEASRRIMAAAAAEAPVSEATQREAAKATDALISEARAKVVSLATRKRERAENAARVTTAKPAAAAKAAARRPAPRKEVAPASTVAADDLKAIGGIGPKLEKALNAMGIASYAQIAALSKAEVARIEGEMGFPGRIARDGWVEQAGRLAAERSKA